MVNAFSEAFHWFNATRSATLVAALALLGVFYSWRQARTAKISATAAEAQAIAARDQADAAREQVAVAREQTAVLLRQVEQSELAETERRTAERDALLPAVTVSVQQGRSDPSILVLVIENLGRTTARNVRVTPSAELVRSDGQRISDWKVFSRPIQVMPAGHRLQFFFDVGFRAFEGRMPMMFSFTVEAEGPFGPLPSAVFDVDLDALHGVWIGETSPAKFLKEIERISSSLGEVQAAIRTLDPDYKAWARGSLDGTDGSAEMEASLDEDSEPDS